MRTPLEQRVVCHVCGARYIHHNTIALVNHVPRVTSSPTPCPRCDAPMRPVVTVDVGMAKDLLLTLVGAPSSVKAFGSPAKLLAGRVATVAQLDALMALVGGMDYDAWISQSTAIARGDRQLLADVRRVPDIRAASAGGPLWDRLLAAAAARRAAIAAERGKHLAIAATRDGKPRDAW